MSEENNMPISRKPEIDPTINVVALVESAVKRIDDLREINDKKQDERFTQEKHHIREILALTRQYECKLTAAEAKRIDAIRVVDVQAVQTANDKATQAANVLAGQVSTSADTLRALVATTATAMATQLTQIITPITDRLALLEKNQYQGAGKESVNDPLIQKLFDKMDTVLTVQSTGTGKSAGLNAGWVYLVGAIGLISTIIGIFLTISSF